MDDELNGNIINSLDEEQQQELLLAYNESFDEANLISHMEIKLQHEKWLSDLWMSNK